MSKPSAIDAGLEAILSGDLLAASRLIRRIEDGDPSTRPLLKALYGHGGRARIVALTGAPGVGKSTLAAQLVGGFRAADKRVAVLAVDPSSPFTGGAILGDRIRLSSYFTDSGVFIRSMATRGHLGGLARASGEAIQVLDAMGWDIILIETVGVGQAEVEVVHLADTVILAVEPGAGDDVQAAKAGIMEIAHIFVVNKARREGAEQSARMIEEMLHDRPGAGEDAWYPPVLQTDALDGMGIGELMEAIAGRDAHLEAHPEAADRLRRARARRILEETLKSIAAERYLGGREDEPGFEKILGEIAGRKADPYTAAERLLGSGEG